MGAKSQRVAIYCRLSKEDEDKHLESESIQNQKSLLLKYAVEKGWDIYSIFCDEDFSGMDRERPAFNKLIAEAEQGKFNIILVKTQSRFTRDMELVEKYIHNKFLLWGIRFVAVVDNIDTDVKGNKKARQINGLINEWYLEDLSENIRAVFDMKRREGQYIGSFPIYGYEKDPQNHNHLIVDEEAAEIVRKIFGLYLDGNGKQNIAAILNREEIPNPTKHKQAKGWNYVNGAQINELGLWNRTSVGRILKNEMYLGNMVQGVRKKISYKSKRMALIPEDQWVIVTATHEPIVDRETFATVQRTLGERTKSGGVGEVHLLAGKVRCMECGSSMLKLSNSYKGQHQYYLRCKLYATDKRLCSNHMIRLDLLEEQVTTLLRDYIRQYYEAGSAEQLVDSNRIEKRKAALKKEMKNLDAEIDRRSKAMRDLYLDKSSGLIDTGQFMELNQSYLEEKRKLENRSSALGAELDDLGGRAQTSQAVREKIQGWLTFETLSRELVADFIDTVEIGCKNPETGEQEIRVNWLI